MSLFSKNNQVRGANKVSRIVTSRIPIILVVRASNCENLNSQKLTKERDHGRGYVHFARYCEYQKNN